MATWRNTSAKIIGVFALSIIFAIWISASAPDTSIARAWSWGGSLGLLVLWALIWLLRVIPSDASPQSALRARFLNFCGLGVIASKLIGGPQAFEAGVYEQGIHAYGSYEFQILGQVLLCLYAYVIVNETLRSAFGWPAKPGQSHARGPVGTSRLGNHLTIMRLVTAVSASLAVAASMPPFAFSDELILVPSIYSHVPSAMFLGACAFGFIYRRYLRKRRSTTPRQASAQNWAALGLGAATVCGAVSILLHGNVATFYLSDQASRLLAPWSTAFAVMGFVLPALSYRLAISPSLSGYGGKTARALAAFATTFALAATLCSLGGYAIAKHLHNIAFLPALTALLFVATTAVFACYSLLSWVSLRFGAPRLYKLLVAAQNTAEARQNSIHLEDIAQASLVPLRAATGNPQADPILYVLDPDRELRIDLAGLTRMRTRSMPEDLASELRSTLGKAVIAAEKEEENGRYFEANTLLQVLRRHDTSIVFPLVVEQELIGALLIPNSTRANHKIGKPDAEGMVFSVEEMKVIEELANEMAPHLALVLKGLRSVERSGTIKQQVEDLEEEVQSAHAELALLREEANAMRASGHTLASHRSWISYSDAMREFEYQGKRIAPIDIPLLIVSEPGNDVEHAAWHLHASSTQVDGPWILADCALVEPSDVEQVLFGSETNASKDGQSEDGQSKEGEASSGWLRLAKGGTLVLLNLPALPEALQYRLAVALSSRKILFEESGTSYPLEARIIGTCLSPQGALDGTARIQPKLRAWLKNGTLRLPPLRRREADIPSLALSETDRACRMLGRETLGLAAETITVLRSLPFPGNLDEFRAILWTAVAKAPGPQLKPCDLPSWLLHHAEELREASGLRKVVGGAS